MIKAKFYKFAIIGGGIASTVFLSSFITNQKKGEIALIEAGRGLGGRGGSRRNRINEDLVLNHGAPNFNINNKKNNSLVQNFINELLKNNIIFPEDSEIIGLTRRLKSFNYKKIDFYKGDIYRPNISMTNLSEQILNSKLINNKIDFYFQTLITNLKFINNHWILTSKDGKIIKTKFLICSSNLLLHKRSKKILKTDEIPLRKALSVNTDKKIDKLLKILNEQNYLQRLTFLIQAKDDYFYKDNYSKKYRHFICDRYYEKIYGFERIIFQKQLDNHLGIVIHTKNIDLINNYLENNDQKQFNLFILEKFNKIFKDNNLINHLMDSQNISTMYWRASQPKGIRVPNYYQVCSHSRMAFCGDWFDFEGFGRIEGAILSGLILSKKLSKLII